MIGRLAHIWRYPIKGHGAEPLEGVTLTQAKALPFDRVWAVTHEGSKPVGDAWITCANFSRGAKAPQLMAITSHLDEATGQITLRHPARPDLTFDPETTPEALIEWVRPLIPADRAASVGLARVPGVALTDTAFPSISLNNLATNRSVADALGQPLSPLRWRGNLWFDGLAPFEEFEWVGRRLSLGGAELTVRERITRCLATTANPETGMRDADTLGALQENWGHQQFGVYAEVTKSGPVTVNDKITVLT